MFGELRVGHAEIVSDDMPLLDVQRQDGESVGRQSPERFEVELGEALAAALDVLKVVGDRLRRRDVGRPSGRLVQVYRL